MIRFVRYFLIIRSYKWPTIIPDTIPLAPNVGNQNAGIIDLPFLIEFNGFHWMQWIKFVHLMSTRIGNLTGNNIFDYEELQILTTKCHHLNSTLLELDVMVPKHFCGFGHIITFFECQFHVHRNLLKFWHWPCGALQLSLVNLNIISDACCFITEMKSNFL